MTEQCGVCNNTFEVCVSCNKLLHLVKDEKYLWRKVVCCPQHMAYYTPLLEYTRNRISKEIASKQLQEAIDTFGMIEFNSNVKPIVQELLFKEEIVESNEVKPLKKAIKQKTK